jgi:hypothetical protein
MNLTYEITGLDKLQRKLSPAKFQQAVKAITLGVAEVLKGKLSKYPGPVKKPIQWASNKQRAWYLATRRKAGLGPYTRNSDPWSQRIGPSWATENRGIDAFVGTRVTYAKWVQSEEFQQPMHRNTGWITDKGAVQQAESENVPERVAERVLRSWING